MYFSFFMCLVFFLVFTSIYKNIFNPCSIFFALWGILVGLSSLGLFGALIPSDNTYLMIGLGLGGFGLGFLFGSMNSQKSKLTITNNTTFKGKSEEYELNTKLIFFLFTISSLYLLYQAFIVIQLLKSGLKLDAIRILATSSDYNALRSSNLSIAIQNFIVTPTVYLSIAILPIEWVKGNHSKLLLMSTAFMAIAWVLTTGGRSIIIWFIMYLMYMLWWTGKRIILKKRTKIIALMVVVLSIAILGVSTVSRKGKETSIFFQAYQYFVVPLSHFEYRVQLLDSVYSGVRGYGLASFYGLLYPIMFILNVFGFSYPKLYNTMRYLSFTSLEDVVTLGNIRMNAFVTTFYHFYLDGGLVGIVVGSVIFSFFTIFAFRKANFGKNKKYTLIFLLLFQKLVFSFVRFYFAQPVQAISFILAFFIYTKKIGGDDLYVEESFDETAN